MDSTSAAICAEPLCPDQMKDVIHDLDHVRRHRIGILALLLIWLALVTVMVVTERQYHSAAIACAHVTNQLDKPSACWSAQLGGGT